MSHTFVKSKEMMNEIENRHRIINEEIKKWSEDNRFKNVYIKKPYIRNPLKKGEKQNKIIMVMIMIKKKKKRRTFNRNNLSRRLSTN